MANARKEVSTGEERVLEMLYLAADIEHLAELARAMNCLSAAGSLVQVSCDLLASARAREPNQAAIRKAN
jgi:hypothetical protein